MEKRHTGKTASSLDDLCSAVLNSPARGRMLFAAAVEKTRELWGEVAVEKATEQICKRFDILLQRQFQERADAQRGLIVFSEGRFDARATAWAAVSLAAISPN